MKNTSGFNSDFCTDEIIEKVRQYLLCAVSEKLYKHCMRTAKMCSKLCAIHGLNEKSGYLAGLSHDMCKCMNAHLLISLSQRDGQPISPLQEKMPSLLHGRAAAVKLYEDFGVKDSYIIEAVANHTLGKKGMCSLAKLLFIADKIEPGRSYITEEYLKKLYKLPLDELTKTVVKQNIEHIKSKGKIPAAETQELLDSL